MNTSNRLSKKFRNCNSTNTPSSSKKPKRPPYKKRHKASCKRSNNSTNAPPAYRTWMKTTKPTLYKTKIHRYSKANKNLTKLCNRKKNCKYNWNSSRKNSKNCLGSETNKLSTKSNSRT